MRILKLILTLVTLSLVTVSQAQEKKLAFPGAEGFGRYTTGGRGGSVYHVTRLDDDNNPGSFRYACTRSGTRTIVFDVSGTIKLTKELKLSNGNVTIAGQTAPGDGICIADYPFVISANNVIIRFMRFRLGNRQVAYHEGDGLGGMDKKNIIVDHCSVSWSIDECLSVYGSENITVQWCIASQSLVNSGHSKGAHGYGGNWGGKGASYHHNLIAHHTSRTPRLGPRPSTQTDERMDMRNNVIYNYGGNGCYGGEGMNVNMVNNYYKPGPGSPTGTKGKRIACVNIRTVDYCLDKKTTVANYNKVMGTSLTDGNVKGSGAGGINYVTIGGKKYPIDMATNKIDVDGKAVTVAWNDWAKMLQVWGKYYLSGNVNTAYPDVTSNNWANGFENQIDKTGNDGTFNATVAAEMKLTSPIPFEAVTTHSAEDAYEKVLQYAGASLHRDWVDDLMANDTRKGVATYTGSGNSKGFINSQNDNKPSDASADWDAWPILESKTAPVDTDQDGMPDEWEDANGLDKNNANDGKTVGADGYTNLEKYMNSLVEHIMKGGNEGGTLEGMNTSGIQEMTAEKTIANNRIYAIDARYVGTSTDRLPSGIYIRNGKKFVVK